MGRLFGTDGVRGVANTQLSCALALSLGKAAAAVFRREKDVRRALRLHDGDGIAVVLLL